MIQTDSKPTLVSLFAGCGGSSLGYKWADYDIRLAVEWDEGAVDIYRRNFPGANVHHGDITQLSGEQALEMAGVAPGELDVLDGSPPCQGFSTAGLREFDDTRNRLFEEYIRLLDAYRPKVFIMENVTGLKKGKMKLTFAEMTRAMKAQGYTVSCRELNAWWWGVPQNRRRLIWIGTREDLGIVPSHPTATYRKPVSVAQALNLDGTIMGFGGGWFKKTPEWETDGPLGLAMATSRLKIKGGLASGLRPHSPTDIEEPAPTLGTGRNRLNVQPVVGIEEWAGSRNGHRFRTADEPAGTLAAIRPPRVASSAVDVNHYGKDNDWVPTEKPARTLRVSQKPRITGSFTFPQNVDRDGKPMEEPVGALAAIRPPSVTDGSEVRYLNIWESKTLQGFPDWFDIRENEYKYVGNSVCPPMAEAVGSHVRKLLGV
ncbi:site-specific DNA methylase [uncultured Mediterranean phage uvDeep-CGR0-KM14-C182]|nr:site-specific DNA methylase [uncultured Mediterranean phage uvDeep-CGR0-KM14-C182]